MANESAFRRRPWAAAAGALGLVMVALFISLIVSRGDVSLLVVPWAALMATGAAGALASTRIDGPPGS